MSPEDPRHGTDNGYRNLGCRCQPCRDAHAEWMREARPRYGARLTADDPRHGRSNTYLNQGCRCAACCNAHTDVKRMGRRR
jgi:hypothetical protein